MRYAENKKSSNCTKINRMFPACVVLFLISLESDPSTTSNDWNHCQNQSDKSYKKVKIKRKEIYYFRLDFTVTFLAWSHMKLLMCVCESINSTVLAVFMLWADECHWASKRSSSHRRSMGNWWGFVMLT